MRFRSHLLLAPFYAAMALPCRADDGLTQTTIAVHAAGKAVGGIIFPIGAKVDTAVVANQTDEGANTVHYRGNVEGRFRQASGQPVIMFGEHIVVSTEPISAARAKAVQDIAAMAASDQLYRGRSATADLTPDEWQRQTAIDVANMRRLAEIIDAYGWPGLRFAGAASQTAFLVLQHADHDSQRKYLPQLRAAVERSDALAMHLAMLEDRVRVHEGKPQLYGSQLSTDPLRFDPIEDEAHVDERRRAIGLGPLADYAKRFGLTYPATAAKDGAAAHAVTH